MIYAFQIRINGVDDGTYEFPTLEEAIAFREKVLEASEQSDEMNVKASEVWEIDKP